MSKINILSPHIADLIAAGEVVERPASALKELVENSIDAGATSITAEIRSGGMSFIRIIDNGHGMSAEDAGIAFLRHATSKINNEQSLEAIGTLGFRGEALAAIASVSKVEMFTRETHDDIGTFISVEASNILDMDRRGGAVGTSITVRGLFYNTPARLKFMKSDKSEATACTAMISRIALAHPEVSIRFIKDDKEAFFTSGDGILKNTIHSILGREFSSQLVYCESDYGKAKISGYIVKPEHCRGSRSAQYFFCNGRHIKSTCMQAAIEQAYKNATVSGRFPACVLNLELNFSEVDVNVHPAKTEVKFSDEKAVFDAVYYACLGAIRSLNPAVAYVKTEPKEKVEEKFEETFQKASQMKIMSDLDYSLTKIERIDVPEHVPIRPAPSKRYENDERYKITHRPVNYSEITDRGLSIVDRKNAMEEINSVIERQKEISDYRKQNSDIILPLKDRDDIKFLDKTETDKCLDAIQGLDIEPKIVCEVMDLYIIVEFEDKILFIDKHAAHERLLYDRFLKEKGQFMSQALIEPIVFKLDTDTVDLYDESKSLLKKSGFEIDDFGDEAIIIRAVPSGMQEGEVTKNLEGMFRAIKNGAASIDSREKLVASMACKAAIKAGYVSDVRELMVLVKAVCIGQVVHCPHGRPVSFTMTRAELDKRFDRIV